ncbi:hypothetical protein OQX61_04335 [Pedobacter sp. PLR]|uniref:hypothetical protein n=1 Tax=Pedobacter sp. PLR TaxID=2994465 RepID=UPI0022469C18|nr:hypothetical protein [Pedobacter sp. PLR]MCX2450494.1 hypothetical protein [Pedobacter sp. PLR]
MRGVKGQGFTLFKIGVLCMVMVFGGCKKQSESSQKIKPPVRSYVVTARIDKKGANTDSEGTAVLKGKYDEGSKLLSYSLEYDAIVPEQISFRNGVKGSKGTLIQEIKLPAETTKPGPLSGVIVLTPLQERNLLKGYWFVVINTLQRSPEVSGVLTLKQI